MKKILFIIIFSILINPLYAGPKDKVKKSGFISKKIFIQLKMILILAILKTK